MVIFCLIIVVLIVATTPLSLLKIVLKAGTNLDWATLIVNCRAGYVIYQANYGPYQGFTGFLELVITVGAAACLSLAWMSRSLLGAAK